INFSEEQIMKEDEANQVADTLWEKIKAKFKSEENTNTSKENTAQISEAEKKELIAEAVKLASEATEATLAEELKKRDDLILALAPMIEFGEKLGNITATKEADAMVDSTRVNAMKEEMGIKSDGGAK